MEVYKLGVTEGPKYMLATVSAIIERLIEGELRVYIQTRWEPNILSSGTFEIPGGRIEAGEDIYSALRREVEEETGLEITKIKPESTTIVEGRFGQKGVAFTPFCGIAYYGRGVVGYIFVCEAKGDIDEQKIHEAKDPRWVKLHELKRLIEEEPNSFFPYYLGALKYYIDQKEKGLI